MPLDRPPLIDWYRRNRARSRALFDLVDDEAYYTKPIALRHPIVFYEGHLPAFSFNTLVKKALGGASIAVSFGPAVSRGIDPHETAGPKETAADAAWPTREVVHQFAEEADHQVLRALANADVDRPGDALLDRGEAVFAILEHEAMHQETLLYMWHRLPLARKRRPAGYSPRTNGAPPRHEWIEIPAGRATLGVDRAAVPFGWDNEFSALTCDVPAFAIEQHDVTSQQFLEFVDAGGYRDQQWWRPEDWEWVQREQVTHPLFWEVHDNDWFWRGMARVRQQRRSTRVRAMARWTSADGSRVPARSIRLAGRRASASMGLRDAVGRPRRVRFFELGSRTGRYPSKGK